MKHSTGRRELQELLATVAADASFGYAVTAISFAATLDLTLQKAGASFVLWLRPGGDATPCYKKTLRCAIGHRGDPPDPLGYALMDAVCAQLARWERAQPESVLAHLFDQGALPPAVPGGTPLDFIRDRLPAPATFVSIYQDWLEVREGELSAHFATLPRGPRNILLVNATKGLPFYASIVDFFALLQRTHEGVRVTSSSYFDSIFEFHDGVAAKGLPMVSVAELLTWDAAAVNRFDVVLMIGASELMIKLMMLQGVTAKLVLLDLGFYHQLLDSYPDWYPGVSIAKGGRKLFDAALQRNGVTVYSCQPQEKIVRDLDGVCALPLLEWRWFNYIPIGFSYCTYYRSDERAFDVALLGTDRREYEQIDPDLFGAVRFLFLGDTDKAPTIARLRERLDITVVSRVDEDTYARLLALCHCVVLPHRGSYVENVFMSVVDTIASGRALVTPPHPGLARLQQEGLPMVSYDASPLDLFRQVDAFLRDAGRRREIEANSVAFAKRKLDIYRILERILEERAL